MNWRQFEDRCPELSEIARRRFTDDELVLIGTLRRDGSPRISPVEPDFVAGELVVGMMWRSLKAADLSRDPRLTLHSVPSGRLNPRGDVKLSGRARAIDDEGLRNQYEEAVFARIAWRPTEPYHCFAIEIERAAYVRFEERVWEWWSWQPSSGLSKETKPNV